MSLRLALLAAVALAAAFWIGLTLYRWGTGESPDLLTLARAVQRGEELAPHIEAGQRRDDARRALAAEVVAGKMTLQEAAGHFRSLDEADPGYPPGLPRPLRDERALRAVLSHVWVVLAHQGRFAEAARWYAEVFPAHPHLLAGPPTGHRYYAAWAAVLAGCGKARDAAGLDEESRAAFRHQALGWLRDELEAQRRMLEAHPERGWSVGGGLTRWLGDPNLAGVRGPDALARLPEEERRAWQQLWEEVEALRQRAAEP
jgi:hypothetical protein